MENSATTDRTSITGMVVNIQHFCTEDGPGIRTTVFLKGCSLRCKWCSNPETIHPKPELAYNIEKCIGKRACGLCLKPLCPEGAMYVIEGPDDRVHINWELASECGEECASVCPTGALYVLGRKMSVEQVLADVETDTSFYAESGGGLTISGGECMLQADFSSALLAEAHAPGIHTCIETASNVPWNNYAKVIPNVDIVYHDIKAMDPEIHKKWTGASNKQVLANLQRAYTEFPNTKFVARTPLIPGVNDSKENIRATLAFIRPHPNVLNYKLLPYHRFGQSAFWGTLMNSRTSAHPRRKASRTCARSSTKPSAAPRHGDRHHPRQSLSRAELWPRTLRSLPVLAALLPVLIAAAMGWLKASWLR